jgi:hypothetical protein
METYIRYQRFTKDINRANEIQEFLDEIVKEGWEIIYYNEKVKDAFTLTITILGGKKQSNVL